MMGRIWWVAVLLLAASCGSDDEQSDSDKRCDQGKTKAAGCGGALASGVCASPCLLECVIDATCDDLSGTPPNPFYVCQAVCQGVADPFFCKDGQHFVRQTEVCNGRPGCPDGSDEENCTDTDGG